jgi:hypothetical protein
MDFSLIMKQERDIANGVTPATMGRRGMQKRSCRDESPLHSEILSQEEIAKITGYARRLERMRSLFLSPDELFDLTGRKIAKLQIEQLRRMMIPFHVNALGRPVVTVNAIIGTEKQSSVTETTGWTPRVLSNG